MQTQNQIKVALTVDDLPNHGPLGKGDTRISLARSLLSTIKQHKIPNVVGFINAKKIEEEDAKLSPKEKLLKRDYQVSQALNYLKSWNVFKQIGSAVAPAKESAQADDSANKEEAQPSPTPTPKKKVKVKKTPGAAKNLPAKASPSSSPADGK